MDASEACRKDPPENPDDVTIWPYREVYSTPPGLECPGKWDEPSNWRCLPVHWERHVGFARPTMADGALEFAS